LDLRAQKSKPINIRGVQENKNKNMINIRAGFKKNYTAAIHAKSNADFKIYPPNICPFTFRSLQPRKKYVENKQKFCNIMNHLF
jgi:hypothetical protein